MLRSVLGTVTMLGGTGGVNLGGRLGGTPMYLFGAWTCRTVEGVARRRLNLFRSEIHGCPAGCLDLLKAATAGFPQRSDLDRYKTRC